MAESVVGALGGAVYEVLTYHHVHPDPWEGKRRLLAKRLARYTEHEVHGFFVARERAGHHPRASVNLLEQNPACIEWEQAMGGKPVPWGRVDQVMLKRLQRLFVGLGMSTKMAANVDDPTPRQLDDRRLLGKMMLLRQEIRRLA